MINDPELNDVSKVDSIWDFDRFDVAAERLVVWD